MEDLAEIFNILTTSSRNSIASSFTTNRDYFVSTVNQQKHQPNYPTKFCSIIKLAGPSFEPIMVVDANSAREAAENHVALVRMGTSFNEAEWSHQNLAECQPEMISNMLLGQSMYPDDFSSNYCKSLIQASGIHRSSGGKILDGMNINSDILRQSLWVVFVLIGIAILFLIFS